MSVLSYQTVISTDYHSCEKGNWSGHLAIQSTLAISTSLISNNLLSRSENLVPALTWKSKDREPNIEEKRSNFPFPQHFQYISNFRSQITYSFVKCGCSIYFSSILQYVEVRISRSISKSPLHFEITSESTVYSSCIYSCSFALPLNIGHFSLGNQQTVHPDPNVANSAVPDQTPQNAASNQGLHTVCK